MFIVGDLLISEIDSAVRRYGELYLVIKSVTNKYGDKLYDVAYQKTGKVYTNQSMNGFMRFGSRQPIDLEKWIK